MKCTFYRTEGINTKEWDRIIRSLHTDLAMMEDGLASKDEIRQYLKDLLDGKYIDVTHSRRSI